MKAPKFKDFITEAKNEKYRLLIVTDEPEKAKTFHTANRLQEEAEKLGWKHYLYRLTGGYTSYEDGIYQQIVESSIKSEDSDETKALKLLEVTHKFLKPRLELFDGKKRINLRDTIFRSSDIELIDARGACGSYAHVLARLLQMANIEARIGQMKCSENWGCHIVVEAKIDDRFVALDATHNLAFRKDNGSLANFEEIGQNWDYFKMQTPDDYYSEYDYEDFRYTNWQKIPVIMPILKSVIKLVIGERVETLSIRSWVLNTYKAYMLSLTGLYALLLVFSIFMIKRKVFKVKKI